MKLLTIESLLFIFFLDFTKGSKQSDVTTNPNFYPHQNQTPGVPMFEYGNFKFLEASTEELKKQIYRLRYEVDRVMIGSGLTF